MYKDNFWDNYMKVFDIISMVIPYQEMVEEIIRELAIKSGTEKILDAGSGTGILSIEIKKRYGIDVLSLDNSKAAIQIHRKKDPGASTMYIDLTRQLPFSDNYFDRILCILTLHSIPHQNRLNLTKEFYRVMSPGGRLILVNPYTNFSPNRIFASHLKKSVKKYGIIKTVKDLFLNLGNIMKMFYYNTIIYLEDIKNGNTFLKINDQQELMEISGFSNISETKTIYEKSAIMNTAVKII